MRTTASIALLFLSLNLLAQGTQKDLLTEKEINEQVWKPFIKSFNDLNTEAFMALHSKEVVRASRDDGRVMGFDEYSKVTASGHSNTGVNKFQRKLELRFLERWSNNGLAYEVGIYKSQSIRPSGNNSVFYGKFHVVMRKENGTWKILVDSDSSEGSSISDKDFLSARPME